MLRRASYTLGLALLLVTMVALPARAAECLELQPNASGPKGQVAANMDGQQVVGGGDPDGTGTVLLTLENVDKKTAYVAYQVSTTNVATPFEGAHIHKSPPGENGLSVKQLFGYTEDADRSGTVTMSKCLAHDIFNRPADFYVDLHNREHPDNGAIRGQLTDAL